MKKVLVTGANKGIGFAICERLLKEYADVAVLLGSRDKARGEEAVAKLQKDYPGRCDLLVVDVNQAESVKQAASTLKDASLYGVVANAGIGWQSTDDPVVIIKTNYNGTRFTVDAFLPKLQPSGGRLVATSSASGPMFVAGLKDNNTKLQEKFASPWLFTGGVKELDELATSVELPKENTLMAAYGYSKALVNAYFYLLSRQYPDLVVNTQTPGFIATDLTAGMGASKTPWDGAKPAVFLLMDEQVAANKQGRYYGSDCKRSPFDVYRGPGDPEYDGPDGPDE